MTESVWSKSTWIPERKSLSENIEMEVTVIGAGITGILTVKPGQGKIVRCGLRRYSCI